MKINFYLLLLIVSFGLLISGCSKGEENNQEVVELSNIKLDDGKGSEVVMTDSDTEKRLPPVPTFGDTKEPDTKYVDKDGSAIRISSDGQGNRIETRHFFNHPNLKMLIVTISKDGVIREGTVYGHNNEHKNLPPDFIDKALTAHGNEIAYKVGITTTKINPTQPTVKNTTYNPSLVKIPDPRIQPAQPQTQTEQTQEQMPATSNEQTVNQKPPDEKDNNQNDVNIESDQK